MPSLYELLAKKVEAESTKYEQICEIINGVETDKEQPYIFTRLMRQSELYGDI